MCELLVDPVLTSAPFFRETLYRVTGGGESGLRLFVFGKIFKGKNITVVHPIYLLVKEETRTRREGKDLKLREKHLKNALHLSRKDGGKTLCGCDVYNSG